MIQKTNHRTKKIIRSAFLDILERKNFHQLTIMDIANEAEISRGTFYFHYPDKYALLEEFESEIMEGLKHAILETKNETCESNPTKTAIPLNNNKEKYDAIYHIITFLYQHAQLVKFIFSPNGIPECIKKIKERYITLIFDNLFIMQDADNESGHYYVPFIVSGLMGIVEEWSISGFKESPKEITDIIFVLFENCASIKDCFIKRENYLSTR